MKPYRLPIVALSALFALQMISDAAQSVPVSNSGFENPTLSDGAIQNNVPNWINLGAGSFGVVNPSSMEFPGEAPEGANVAAVYNTTGEAGVSQTLGGTAGKFLANASYALTVKVGNNAVQTGFPGYRVQLLANGTVLAEDDNTQTPAEGAFATSTFIYSYNAGLHSALVGQSLEIRLLGKGVDSTEVDFDDVQLSVTLANPVSIPGGPYTVFTGGFLVLNGSASLPSDGATVTSYEWDLNNDGSFSEGITGVTPAPITQATLTSTYGMSLGGNTIKLRVTDSAAKTSVADATVNILPATAVVYEPFNYSGTALAGASGSSEVGLTGTWTSSTTPTLGGNLSFGPLVTRGAGIATGTGSNTFGGARAVSASALADNGLLTDGVTLWFSMIVGYNTGGNLTNSRLGFALSNSQFNSANFKYYINDEGAQVGSGLGLTLGAFSGVNGKVVATQFRDANAPVTNPTTGFNGNVFGTVPASALYTAGGQYGLIVGKITWGAASDTIDLYKANADLTLPATPFSTLTVSVNQSTYDTITWARGDAMLMDEIRFGASYAAVIETGSAWDLNGATAGAGSATPSGTWNADSNWNLASDGTLVPIPWQAGGVATFAAGNDATGAYTVTVNGTRDVGGIVFEEGTVSLSGGTALRLTANSTVSIAQGLTATISTPFTENAPGRQLAKAGVGTLILSGDNSGVTGGTGLSAGVTRFESPASIPGTTRNASINAAGTAVFGPSFGAGNIPAALANRIDATSTGTIAADNYAATDFDFNTPALTANRLGAVGAVSYTGTLTPSGATYRLGGGGGTLTLGNTNALTGANALVINGNVNITANNDYTGTTVIAAGSNALLAGANATSAVSLDAPGAIVTLGNNSALGVGTLTLINSFAGSSTIQAQGTVVTTNPVSVLNGGVIVAGTGALTLGNFTLNNGVTVTNNNTTTTTTLGAVTAAGVARALAFAGNGNTVVTGSIGGGTNITTVSKGGTGVLSLNSPNTYTGSTTVTGGVLLLNDANAIPGGIGNSGGTNALIINGGVVGLGAGDFSRALDITTTITAVNFTGNGGWAAYGADRLVNLGGASATVAWGTNNTGLNGKTLILSHATATHRVTLQNPLDLGAATRTVQVDNGAAAVDATLSGAISGTAVGLTKSGTGTLSLSAANGYTGATTVSGGTLAMGANNVFSDSSNVLIGAATLNAATFTDTVGTLDVTGAATINLGAGAALVFADTSAVDWTGGTLNITGTFVSGSSLKFGITSGGLTSTQLGLITVNGSGGPFTLDANGFLNSAGSPYGNWSGGAAADIDTNGDGVKNGVAWVLGAVNPAANAVGLLPTLDNTTDANFFIFNYRRSDTAAADANTAIKAQYGSNLVGWTDAAPSVDIVITPFNDFYAAGIDKVEVKIRRTLAAGNKLFARLNVAVAP